MILSFAPMEGVTNSIFRRVHARFFPGTDRYYAPFLAPDGCGKVKRSALRDLEPEQNRDLCVIPQILCNRPEAFLHLGQEGRHGLPGSQPQRRLSLGYRGAQAQGRGNAAGSSPSRSRRGWGSSVRRNSQPSWIR